MMSTTTQNKTVLFEPWHLGDAVIAASILRVAPTQFTLACASRFHPILRTIFGQNINPSLLALDLTYTKGGKHRFDMGVIVKQTTAASRTISIRGDIRDYLAARKSFPDSRVEMCNWIAFAARRSSVINLPFSRDLLPTRNRYHAWAALAGIGTESLDQSYAAARADNTINKKVAIYIGSKFLSRQYPHVEHLRQILQNSGFEVMILANRKEEADNLGMKATLVSNHELIYAFKRCRYLISNDTGPMHIGAFLGCITLVMARISNMDEWRPPGAHVSAAPETPRGYRPHKSYLLDTPVTGWVSAEDVAEKFFEIVASDLKI